jgi:hypothetical protein
MFKEEFVFDMCRLGWGNEGEAWSREDGGGGCLCGKRILECNLC